jgi:GntR family transcriptional repressor for pyruvate dehydrogenase complex
MHSPVAPSRTQFAPVTSQRAFEDIASQIRLLVAGGQLRPGDHLPPERELVERFGVSRNAVREALRSLELAGLIELRMGASGGAVLKAGNPSVVVNGLSDLYHVGAIQPIHVTEARIWIEGALVEALCARITDAEIELLKLNVKAMEKAQAAEDYQERARLNLEFHTMLGAASRNPIMEIVMRAIMELMGLFVDKIGQTQKSYTVPSRRRLLRHLANRDAGAARQEMVSFLDRLHKDYMSSMPAAEASPAPASATAAAAAQTRTSKPRRSS